jgi:hypothetical protein
LLQPTIQQKMMGKNLGWKGLQLMMAGPHYQIQQHFREKRKTGDWANP